MINPLELRVSGLSGSKSYISEIREKNKDENINIYADNISRNKKLVREIIQYNTVQYSAVRYSALH